jgi:hypothetical protein
MGIFDDVKGKAGDMMDDPANKIKIEQIAREKGLSIEDAKKHFMKENEDDSQAE